MNTVLGTIKINKAGVTLIHEHIICNSPFMHKAFGNKWFERGKLIEMASGQLKRAKEKYGIQTIVDGTPINLGRDIHMLEEVSKRSGVNIIASSGMYYAEDPFLRGKPAEQLAELFIHECRNGMEETGILPGILKCATDTAGFTPVNKMLLKMISIVQKATGLPLFAHSSANIISGSGQLDIFEENGADLSRVVIGHCADTRDLDYLESLLNRGCYIGLDRFRYLESRIDMISELIKCGWIKQLLLSHDFCSFIDFGENTWEKYKKVDYENNESNFTFIHRKIIPLLLQKGITEKQIHQLFVENPANLLQG